MRTILAAALLPLAFLLPFSGKAFHIDDPMYLWTAEHIQSDAIHFYQFDVNWFGFPQPMFEANQNPPGTAYLLAALAKVVGWSEAGLHIFMALLGSVAAVGVLMLARRLCSRPLLATALCVLTPAFVVSANTVMTDIPLLACSVWAVVLWIRALERECLPLFFASALLVTLAISFKYFGVSLIPLLFVYTWIRQKRVGFWAVSLIVPVAFLAAYEALTYTWFDRSLFLDALKYTREAADASVVFRPDIRGVTSLTFTGAAAASAFFFAPFIWSRKGLLAGFGIAAATGIVLWMQRDPLLYMVYVSDRRSALIAVQVTLWFAAGLHVVVLVVDDLRRTRNAESVLLALWILGTLAFAAFLNWSVTVRSILPMLPAVSILVVRRLRPPYSTENGTMQWPLAIPLVAAAILTLSVTWADYTLANSGKIAAERLAAESDRIPNRHYYEGHWGFQYYMERSRLRYFEDHVLSFAQEGDRIAVPRWSSVRVNYNVDLARIDENLSFSLPTCRWLATMHPQLGAGFYSHTFGPLPFTFGPVPSARYDVYVLGHYN